MDENVVIVEPETEMQTQLQTGSAYPDPDVYRIASDTEKMGFYTYVDADMLQNLPDDGILTFAALGFGVCTILFLLGLGISKGARLLNINK